MSAALGAGKGDPEGQATTFFIFIILPTPQPCGDVYSWATSAGWQATSLLLECLESPRSQENGTHSLGPASSLCSHPLLAFEPTCNLSPPHCPAASLYLPPTSHLGTLGSLSCLLYAPRWTGRRTPSLCPLPVCCFHLNLISPCGFL